MTARHWFNTQNSIIFIGYVDSYAKIFLILNPRLKTPQPVLPYCIDESAWEKKDKLSFDPFDRNTWYDIFCAKHCLKHQFTTSKVKCKIHFKTKQVWEIIKSCKSKICALQCQFFWRFVNQRICKHFFTQISSNHCH